MIYRGLIKTAPTSSKPVFNPTLTVDEIHPADIYFLLDKKDDVSVIIDGATESNAQQTFHNLFLYLALALYLKETKLIEELKTFIIKNHVISGAELRDLILKKAVDDKKIKDRIISCINTVLSERKK